MIPFLIRPDAEDELAADGGLLFDGVRKLIVFCGERRKYASDIGIMTAEEGKFPICRGELRINLLKERMGNVYGNKGSRKQNVPVEVLDLRNVFPLFPGEGFPERRGLLIFFIVLEDQGVAGGASGL